MIFYRNIRRPQAMTFDLDDTLYDNYPIMRQSERALADFMDEHFPDTRALSDSTKRQIKFSLLRESPELCNDMGEWRRRTLTRIFSESGYGEADVKRHAEECFNYFYHQRSNFKVGDDVTDTLAYLAERMPLVAITNGNVNLEQIGIAEFFATSFHARLDQPMKPDPTMFERARACLSCPASAILHVGDNLEKDVMGARRAGFSSAWFAVNRPMKLNTEDTTVLPDVLLHQLSELTEFC